MKKGSFFNSETPLFIIPKSYTKGKQDVTLNIETHDNHPQHEEIVETDCQEGPFDGIEEKRMNTPSKLSENHQGGHTKVVKCPGGDLDLSHYEFAPKDASHLTNVLNIELNKNLGPDDIEALIEEKEKVSKKKKMFRRPRKNSRLEKIISFLEDRRIKEDNELHQLEDLKMPKLRKFLNIIFVTFGLLFLFGVIVVIVFASFMLLFIITHLHIIIIIYFPFSETPPPPKPIPF